MSHQTILSSPANITEEIFQTACQVFDEAWDEQPVRHLGIHTTRITKGSDRQLGLFDTGDYEKQQRLDQTVDKIRKRFGNDSIIRASFLTSPQNTAARCLDHMGGGISREKRTVDYSRQTIL